jgi:hypothetical protein
MRDPSHIKENLGTRPEINDVAGVNVVKKYALGRGSPDGCPKHV